MDAGNDSGFGATEIIIVLLVVLLLMLGGIFVYKHRTNNGVSLKGSDKTRLAIKRANTLNQPGVTNFSKIVSFSAASTILSDIGSLKPVPQGTYNCPSDDGVEYSFNFTNPTLSAAASATGCQWVTINNRSYSSTDRFWKDVGTAVQQPIDPNSNFR